MTFDDLHTLAAGFQPAQLLLTALDLGVFEHLAHGPASPVALAGALGVDRRATEIALNGLAALGVVEADAGRYRNSDVATQLLVTTSAGYKGAILRHLHHTWADWASLGETWKTGAPTRVGESQCLPSTEANTRDFILGMENVTRELAPRIAERLPLARCRKVLDLGAGPGNYVLAFVAANPDLEAVHFDLPVTSRIAREFVVGRPGVERVTFREGNFLEDDLGEGYDLIWISQILHMLGEDEAADLIAKAIGVLAEGGVLAVHDHFLDTGRTSPVAAALFGVHMLVATPRGRAYAFEEVEAWVRRAGFDRFERVVYGGPCRILMATGEGS